MGLVGTISAKFATLTCEGLGFVASIILFFNSYSLEKATSTWFREAYEAEKTLVDERNRRRILMQMIGFGMLCASFFIQFIVTWQS